MLSVYHFSVLHGMGMSVGRGSWVQVVGRGFKVVGCGSQVVGRWFQVVGRGLLIGRDLHQREDGF